MMVGLASTGSAVLASSVRPGAAGSGAALAILRESEGRGAAPSNSMPSKPVRCSPSISSNSGSGIAVCDRAEAVADVAVATPKSGLARRGVSRRLVEATETVFAATNPELVVLAAVPPIGAAAAVPTIGALTGTTIGRASCPLAKVPVVDATCGLVAVSVSRAGPGALELGDPEAGPRPPSPLTTGGGTIGAEAA